MPDGLIVFSESTLTKASTAFDWWRAEAQRCGIRLAVAFAEQIQMRYVDGNALTLIGGRQIDTPRFRGHARIFPRHIVPFRAFRHTGCQPLDLHAGECR